MKSHKTLSLLLNKVPEFAAQRNPQEDTNGFQQFMWLTIYLSERLHSVHFDKRGNPKSIPPLFLNSFDLFNELAGSEDWEIDNMLGVEVFDNIYGNTHFEKIAKYLLKNQALTLFEKGRYA